MRYLKALVTLGLFLFKSAHEPPILRIGTHERFVVKRAVDGSFFSGSWEPVVR